MVVREMKISEVVTRWPESIEVFFDFGLGCVGCQSAAFETIEDGCIKHGFGDEEIDELIDEINKRIAKKK